MGITITKPQKKVLAYTVIGAIIIFLFWSLVYLPGSRQVQRFQLEFEKVNKQLNEIKKIEEIKRAIAEGYIYTESIESLSKELAILNKSIATEEETVLQYISSSGRKPNLEIISIKPSSKELLLDKDENRIKIAGSDCFQLPVRLRLKGSYKAIGSYIEGLRKDAPSLVSIENLKIDESAREENKLIAGVNLTIYLKSKK